MYSLHRDGLRFLSLAAELQLMSLEPDMMSLEIYSAVFQFLKVINDLNNSACEL